MKRSIIYKAIRLLHIGILVITLACFVQQPAFATQWLKIDSVQAFPSAQVTLNIAISNSEAFTSFQLDIAFPQNVIVDPATVLLNPLRATDHMISATLISDSVLRIICFSMNNNSFIGNDGIVASLELTLPATAMEAPLPITNALIGNALGQNILTGTIDGALKAMDDLLVDISLTSDSLCLGGSSTLFADVSGGGWFMQYIWASDPPGFNELGATIQVSPEQSTSYFVTVNDGFQMAQDTAEIHVSLPAEANAGSDQQLCAGAIVQLNAIVNNADSLRWSGGTGVFAEANNAQTTYYPSPEDLQQGIFWLRIRAFGDALCGEAVDSLQITMAPAPVVEAGMDYVLPLTSTYLNDDAATWDVDTLYWTSSGDGLFENNLILHPVYIPGDRDRVEGTAVLTIHGMGNMPCAATKDSLLLIILREGDNVMSISSAVTSLNDTLEIELQVDNRTDFTAFEASLQLPESMQWISGSVQLTDRAFDHELISEFNGQQLHVLAFSPSEANFIGTFGAVLQAKIYTGMVSGVFPILLSNASLLNQNGDNVVTQMQQGWLTIILVGATQTEDEVTSIYLAEESEDLVIRSAVGNVIRADLYDVKGQLLCQSPPVEVKPMTNRLALSSLFDCRKTFRGIFLIKLILESPEGTMMNKTLKIWLK